MKIVALALSLSISFREFWSNRLASPLVSIWVFLVRYFYSTLGCHCRNIFKAFTYRLKYYLERHFSLKCCFGNTPEIAWRNAWCTFQKLAGISGQENTFVRHRLLDNGRQTSPAFSEVSSGTLITKSTFLSPLSKEKFAIPQSALLSFLLNKP